MLIIELTYSCIWKFEQNKNQIPLHYLLLAFILYSILLPIQDPITIEKPAPVSESVLDPTSPEKTDDALELIDISTPPDSSQPALDAPDPSRPKMCYSMRFSFEELKKKRQQKLSAFQASKSTPKMSPTKGYATLNFWWKGFTKLRFMTVFVIYIQMLCRCYIGTFSSGKRGC